LYEYGESEIWKSESSKVVVLACFECSARRSVQTSEVIQKACLARNHTLAPLTIPLQEQQLMTPPAVTVRFAGKPTFLRLARARGLHAVLFKAYPIPTITLPPSSSTSSVALLPPPAVTILISTLHPPPSSPLLLSLLGDPLIGVYCLYTFA